MGNFKYSFLGYPCHAGGDFCLQDQGAAGGGGGAVSGEWLRRDCSLVLSSNHPASAQIIGAGWGICYIGIFSVGMAFTLQVVGQRFTPAADAAIILSSETVFAALGGMIFLGERLSPLQLSGGLLILTSILAVELLPMLGKPRPLR